MFQPKPDQPDRLLRLCAITQLSGKGTVDRKLTFWSCRPRLFYASGNVCNLAPYLPGLEVSGKNHT